MSIKIYEAYIIKNIDYNNFFKELNLVRDILIKEIYNDIYNHQLNILKKLYDSNKKYGYVNDLDFSFDFDKTQSFNKKINIDCSLINLASKYFKHLEANKVFDIYNFSICFFSYKSDFLFIPYIQNKKYLDLFKENISNIENYGYWDNVDAPFEEFKKGDIEYVSKNEWNKRKTAWESCLLNKNSSIPSLNGLEFNINNSLFSDIMLNIEKFPKEIIHSKINLKDSILDINDFNF